MAAFRPEGRIQRGVLREDFFGIKRGSNADLTRDVRGMRVGVYAGYRGISRDRVGISWDRVGPLQPREIFFVVFEHSSSHTTQMHRALLANTNVGNIQVPRDTHATHSPAPHCSSRPVWAMLEEDAFEWSAQ